MNPDEFNKKVIRVESASDIKLEIQYVDSDYQSPAIDVKRDTLANGLLVLFKVEPVPHKAVPTFLARWDSNQNTVDIDVQKGSGIDEADFKGGRNGYRGHHPVTLSSDPRVFGIDIWLPSRQLFQAKMSCTIGVGVQLGASLNNFQGELSVKFIPALPEPKPPEEPPSIGLSDLKPEKPI